MKKIAKAFAAISTLSISLFGAGVDTPRKAPDFTFNLPAKGLVDLAQYRGKVVALEFIFTTCPHCQAASKFMSKLQEEYGAKGLQVLDVAVNPNADLKVDNFVKDYDVKFPVGWVMQNQMVAFMGFSSDRFVVPQLALIDRKGIIRYQTPALENEDWDKLMKEDTLRQHVEELLSAGGSSATDRRTSAKDKLAMSKRGL